MRAHGPLRPIAFPGRRAGSHDDWRSGCPTHRAATGAKPLLAVRRDHSLSGQVAHHGPCRTLAERMDERRTKRRNKRRNKRTNEQTNETARVVTWGLEPRSAALCVGSILGSAANEANNRPFRSVPRPCMQLQRWIAPFLWTCRTLGDPFAAADPAAEQAAANPPLNTKAVPGAQHSNPYKNGTTSISSASAGERTYRPDSARHVRDTQGDAAEHPRWRRPLHQLHQQHQQNSPSGWLATPRWLKEVTHVECHCRAWCCVCY